MHHPHHFRNNSFSQTSYPQDWDSSDNPNNHAYTHLQQRPLQPQKINSQSTSYIDKAFSLNNTPSSSDAFHNKLQNLREKFFGSSNDSQKLNPPLFTKQPYQQSGYGTRTASPQMKANHASTTSKSHGQWAEETRGGAQNSDMRNSNQLLGFHRSSIDYYNEQRNMYMIEEEVVEKEQTKKPQMGYFHARSQSNPMMQEQSKYSEVINIFESSENTDPALESDDNFNYSYVNKRMPPPLQAQGQENRSAKKFVTVSSGYSQSVIKEQKMINSFLQGKLAAINNKSSLATQIPKNNVKKFAHVTSRINSGISPNKAQHIPSRTQHQYQQPQHQPRPSKSPKKSPLPSPTQHKKKSPQRIAPQTLYQGNTFGQYEWTDQDEGWISYNPNAASNNNNKSSLNNVESVEISPRNNRRKSMEEVHIMEKACLNIVMALQNVTFKRMNSVFQSLKNVLYTLPEEEGEETSYCEEQEASFGPNPASTFNEKVRRSQERVVLEENQVLQGLIKINNLFINVKALVDRTKLSTFNQLQFQQTSLVEGNPQNNVKNPVLL